jgi:hypothetical protein
MSEAMESASDVFLYGLHGLIVTIGTLGGGLSDYAMDCERKSQPHRIRCRHPFFRYTISGLRISIRKPWMDRLLAADAMLDWHR